jgi:hypothetical protein
VASVSTPTLSAAVVATPSYMAPEQALASKDVSIAADIYSLGAILYELVTGRPPFQAATTLETLQQVVEQEPARPRKVNGQVPRDLETVCLKCLQKDACRRFANAAELATDLERYLQGRPVHARRVGVFERTWKWAKRRPWRAAIIGVLALLTATAGAVLVRWAEDRSWWAGEQSRRKALEEQFREALRWSHKEFSGGVRVEVKEVDPAIGLPVWKQISPGHMQRVGLEWYVPPAVHELQMQAGRVYQIDLESQEFSTNFCVENRLGKKLAGSRWGSSAHDSRLVFTPRDTGTYRIVATFGRGQAKWVPYDSYKLTIRAVAGDK